MSTSFSANQYENAFISKKLQNWECPNAYPEHPVPMSGFTHIIGTDRGHLKEGVRRSNKNPWGNFVGTWDLPQKIPGNCAEVRTARTALAQQKLQREAERAKQVLSGSHKNASRRTTREGTFATNTRVTDRIATPAEAITKSYTSPIGEYRYATSPAFIKQRTPTPDKYRCDAVQSPIPTVPDIPEVLAQDALPRETTPRVTKPTTGLSAF